MFAHFTGCETTSKVFSLPMREVLKLLDGEFLQYSLEPYKPETSPEVIIETGE
jgi:hypothetical protein